MQSENSDQKQIGDEALACAVWSYFTLSKKKTLKPL